MSGIESFETCGGEICIRNLAFACHSCRYLLAKENESLKEWELDSSIFRRSKEKFKLSLALNFKTEADAMQSVLTAGGVELFLR